MRIREGDPMEIFTSREGEILLKKYSPVGELGEFATELAESISQTIGELVCVTDRDYVIAAAGTGKKEYEGKVLDAGFQTAIDNRSNKVVSNEDGQGLAVVQGDEKTYTRQAIATILSHGDCIGAVVILSKSNDNPDEVLLQLAKTVAGFLGRHMEQ